MFVQLDYGCFIYGATCKSYISLLDPNQNQGLRLSLEAFRTSPAHSLCVEANELPLRLRREKLALQFATKIAANPNNPVYDTIFNPRYVDFFARKPRVIPAVFNNNKGPLFYTIFMALNGLCAPMCL